MLPLGASSTFSDSITINFDRESYVSHDEAAKLSSDLLQLQMRLKEVEQERNYAGAKAHVLESAIQAFKQDHVHEKLVKKSLQLAEIAMKLDSLHAELQHLKDENARLNTARTEDKKKMEELSNILRSLQSSNDYNSEDEEGEVILTPEKALDMTLKNMKSRIEFQEDKHQNLSLKCSTQEKKIYKLEKENEMKDIEIGMLEELLRDLNSQQKLEEVEIATLRPQKEDTISLRPRVIRGNRPGTTRKISSWSGLVQSKKCQSLPAGGNVTQPGGSC